MAVWETAAHWNYICPCRSGAYEGKTGVFVDIFVMDDCPKSLLGMIFHSFWCFFLRKILYARVGKVNAKGLPKLCYQLLNLISVNWVYKQVGKVSKKVVTPARIE